MAQAAQHLSRYVFASTFAAGKHVLDVGTGNGYGALMLSSGAASVQAVDLQEAIISAARQRWPDSTVRFFVDDAETLAQVQRPVDLIVSCENIEHLANPSQFVTAAASVLDAGGLLVCSTPDAAESGGSQTGAPQNPFHVNEWRELEFRDLLALGFADVTILKQVAVHAVEMRQQAAQHVHEHLRYLWSSPLNRLGRALRRALGRRTHWPDISGLAATTAADFPVVPARWAPHLGTPLAHVALCRKPGRPRGA